MRVYKKLEQVHSLNTTEGKNLNSDSSVDNSVSLSFYLRVGLYLMLDCMEIHSKKQGYQFR